MYFVLCHADDKGTRDYFWAYGWNTTEGRNLKKRLHELTGLDITTFQGEYEPKRFVIDGEKGRDVVQGRSSDVNSESSPGFLESLFGGKKPTADATDNSVDILPDVSSASVPPEADRSLLEAARTSAEIIHRTAEEQSRSAARDYRAEAGQHSPDPKALAELKEKLAAAVQAAFETQMNLQQIRLQIAQRDLAEVQAKHQRRQALAEKIIERRITDLMNGDDLEWAEKKNAAEPNKSDKKVGPEPIGADAGGTTSSSEKLEMLEPTGEPEEGELPRISKTEIVLSGLRATISRLAATSNVGDKCKVFVELKNESDSFLEDIETSVQFQNSELRILAASPIARSKPQSLNQENDTVLFKNIKSVAPGETIQMSLVYRGEKSTPHSELRLILKDRQHRDGQVLTLPVSVADADNPSPK